MDIICANDIKQLLQNGEGVHVSVMMPAHHKGGVDQQDPIRFKNLLRLAEEKMIQKGLRPTEARLMVKPAEALITDNLFWRQQGDGLALFMESNRFFYYRLPLVLQEAVEVGNRFLLRPLVPIMGKCGVFYILAISQNENRMLQCTLTGSVRINTGDIPGSLAQTLRFEAAPEGSVRLHASSTAGAGGSGAPIQAAASSRANLEKDHILQYFEQVNGGISKILKFEGAPLVLAAVDYLHPLYRKANTYANLMPEGITGNPDTMNDSALREAAWPLVDKYFSKDRLAALADYRQAAGTGATVNNGKEVLEASQQGRVRALFIAESIANQAQSESGDVIEASVYQTLKHAGVVYTLKTEDMPEKVPVVALLRY
jgi:hypothetical protein